MAEEPGSRRALVFVSLGVLLAGSTWFTGTAAVPALRAAWGLGEGAGAWLTTGVQLGFIAGTFLYAVFNVADVFSARLVFLASALAAAAFNLAFAFLADGPRAAVALRFLNGVCLAGVYPVGMKIVASWFRSGLGWRLGVLVGALVLGTASPYLVQALGAGTNWRPLAASASLLAAAGGLLVALGAGDGPYLRQRARFDVRAAARVFRAPAFRWTAFGYFGHMWELYALWSLCLYFLRPRFAEHASAVAFLLVAMGAVGCAAGGWASRSLGERRVALWSLLLSASACLLSGFAQAWPTPLLLAFVATWGFFVVADSPQFSALAARHCPPEYTATALTIQNGIGFAVTVVSIQALPWVAAAVGWRWAFVTLAPGPLLGAAYMSRLSRHER
jgi:MFS family permease